MSLVSLDGPTEVILNVEASPRRAVSSASTLKAGAENPRALERFFRVAIRHWSLFRSLPALLALAGSGRARVIESV